MITLSGPSCATTQVPTIGSKVAGGLPTVSLLRSILMSAANVIINNDTTMRFMLVSCERRTGRR